MPTIQEEFCVSGEKLVDSLKEIVHEGNVRHIVIKNEKGDTLIEIPLTIGVVAAMAAKLTIVVVRDAPVETPPAAPAGSN
jgi:hypothetical protein